MFALLSEGLGTACFSLNLRGVTRRARYGRHGPLCPVFIPFLLWGVNLAGPFARVEKTHTQEVGGSRGTGTSPPGGSLGKDESRL